MARWTELGSPASDPLVPRRRPFSLSVRRMGGHRLGDPSYARRRRRSISGLGVRFCSSGCRGVKDQWRPDCAGNDNALCQAARPRSRRLAVPFRGLLWLAEPVRCRRVAVVSPECVPGAARVLHKIGRTVVLDVVAGDHVAA